MPYLVMEFVEGDDLRSRVAAGPLPLAQAVVIARRSAPPSRRPTRRV